MIKSNEIVSVDGGYQLVCDNAQSIDIYSTWEDAVEASKADQEAHTAASDQAEYEDTTPVEWE